MQRVWALTFVVIAGAVLVFAACSSGSDKSSPLSTVAPVRATAAPCNEDHAIATMRAATVRVSTATTSGTGIVVDMGVVLTLDHVVARAGAVTVSTANGPYEASVRSEDPANDLALLMVPQLTSPSVKWGDTGGLVAGQRLVAFTYPETATGGAPGSTSGGFTGMVTINGAEYVRTDTSADSDSTGGPLFTLCGEVVGLNTLSARTGPALAVPSSVLRRFSGAATNPAAPDDPTKSAPPPSGSQ